MDKFLTFGIVGLSTGGIYAVISSGLVLTYTTTGIFNFAHGAAGMMAAFAYWQLTGGWGLPVPIALALVLLVLAPLFGLLVERVIMRPVQGVGEVERLVVTIALLTGLIALAQWIWDPNVARPLTPFFAEREAIQIGPATMTWHQLVTLVVAAAVAVGLYAFLYGSRTGVGMRATVDDPSLARLNGGDPVVAAKAAWVLGTMLAALGGILIAPSIPLDAANLSLLIVSAYAAAIFGRLRSLPMAFVGAMVVGCTESFLTGYLPQNEYLPGLRIAAPALLLFLVLLLFPNPRVRGSVRITRSLPTPTLRGTLVFAACLMVFAAILATTLSDPDVISYGQIFPMSIIGLSIVVLTGFSGQISLAQLSLAGIGAVVWAGVGASGNPLALLAVVAVSAVVGAVIAIPALRLSGIYLALATAAFALILDGWIFTMPVDWLFSGGGAEVTPIFSGARVQMLFAAAVLAALCLLAVWVRRGFFGRRLIAMRDSEAACATLGGRLLVTKVAVFALSAAIAGLGGALYGMQARTITPEQFTLVTGLPIFLLVVIGGMAAIGSGFFTGVNLAGIMHAITVLWPGAHHASSLLVGLAGIGMGRHPEGVVPHFRESWSPLRRFWIPLAAIVGALWGLRLLDVVNGWVLTFGTLAAAVALREVARPRASRADADVPLEWRGVRRPWLPSDREEVLDGLARS
ncbi:inner-membrane translocator [Actinomadura sp. LOL_016]|uniref:branched-chain amino acid ABC transporter permease n=1 Tax=unclassified Actinomadura TaxID=2626254 RepID=UPI003A7F91C1